MGTASRYGCFVMTARSACAVATPDAFHVRQASVAAAHHGTPAPRGSRDGSVVAGSGVAGSATGAGRAGSLRSSPRAGGAGDAERAELPAVDGAAADAVPRPGDSSPSTQSRPRLAASASG